MKIEDIVKLRPGDWFIASDRLMYVVSHNTLSVSYSSHSFLSLPESVLTIPFENVYRLVHEDMTYVGKTKSNCFYWLMPTFIAQFICPYRLPSKKQLTPFI